MAGLIVVGVVTGLIATAIWAGLGVARKWFQALSPLEATFDRVTKEPWTYVMPRELPIEQPPSDVVRSTIDVNHWLYRHGAVQHYESEFRLLLRNTSQDRLMIHDLHVKLLERTDALAGSRITCPTAGANDALLLLYDLDEDHPVAWQWKDDAGPRVKVGTTPHFDRANISLESGETTQLQIVGRTEHHYCRWQLEATVSGDNKKLKRVPLLSGEQCFRTSGTPDGGFDQELEWAWYDPSGPTFRRPPWLDET